MIEFFLALDEWRSGDDTVEVKDITCLVDAYARQEIGDYVKVDFHPMQGFKLINTNQTLAYGLRMKSMEQQ